MNFNDWVAKNSLLYRGYVIGPAGSVSKDGEVVLMLPDRLGDTAEQSFARGRAAVDGFLDGAAKVTT